MVSHRIRTALVPAAWIAALSALLFVSWPWTVAHLWPSRALPRPSGLWVEEVAPDLSLPPIPGLQRGDLLVRWERTAFSGMRSVAEGDLRLPSDLTEVILAQKPMGPTALYALRQGRLLRLHLPVHLVSIPFSRPALSPVELLLYETAERSAVRGDTEAATQGWRSLQGLFKRDHRLGHYAWLSAHTSRVLLAADKLELARSLIEDASKAVAAAGDARLEAYVLRETGAALGNSRRATPDTARDAYCGALAARRRCCSKDLWYAAVLFEMGLLAKSRSADEALAEVDWLEGLAIARATSPQSALLGSFLLSLANSALARGDFLGARTLNEEALRLAVLRGDELSRMHILNNDGVAAYYRGDYAKCERLYWESLHIQEKLFPAETPWLATTWVNLGDVLWERGNLADAHAMIENALALLEKHPAHEAAMVAVLTELARLSIEEGRESEVESRLGGCISRIHDDLLSAQILEAMGDLQVAHEDLAAARRSYDRAREILEREQPGGYALIAILSRLASVALEGGTTAEAREYASRALAISRTVAPDTIDEMRVLHTMGLIAVRERDDTRAIASWRRAADVADRYRSKVGASGLDRLYASRAVDSLYFDLVSLLVRTGRPGEALDVVERSRARAFRELLEERDYVFPKHLHPDFAREERAIATDYRRAQELLSVRSSGGDEGRGRLYERLSEIRLRRSRLIERVRARALGGSDFRYAEPLHWQQIRQDLDPGTMFLSYAVGREETYLFALSRRFDGVVVKRIPVGQKELQQRVSVFRGLIRRGRDVVEVEEALLAQGHKLFELLVQPVERFLLPMRRLLIIPDGPLHALPFGALVRSPEPREYLAEWKPLHVAASGSVHAELAARARSAAARTYREQLVVVAAPDADRALGGQDGLAGDLPGARLEAEALTQIIPSARVYTGSAASEERVRSLGEGIRYIHIATHGFVDGRSPFDGGLFLAPSADVPEKDGLLKAWDILAEIRVDSELVVLSACDTGGGAILGPEGVVGLTRAWQHAGVPSVVASLWPVSDSSTATLMRCFYQALQAGLKRDEALQSAQRALIDRSGREPRAARLRHPFHWASFQLYGQP